MGVVSEWVQVGGSWWSVLSGVLVEATGDGGVVGIVVLVSVDAKGVGVSRAELVGE